MEQEQKPKGLGQRLSVLAKLKGLTQEEIAKECAISRISVNRFFRERTEIRANDFKALLSVLGINLDMVIDRAIENQIHGIRSPREEGSWGQKEVTNTSPIELKALP